MHRAVSLHRALCTPMHTHPSSSCIVTSPVQFFGYLFDKKEEADAAYCGTVSRYSCNSLVAKHEATVAYSYVPQLPKVLFASYRRGKHSLHVPPYKSQFVQCCCSSDPVHLSVVSSPESCTGLSSPSPCRKVRCESASTLRVELSISNIVYKNKAVHTRPPNYELQLAF